MRLSKAVTHPSTCPAEAILQMQYLYRLEQLAVADFQIIEFALNATPTNG